MSAEWMEAAEAQRKLAVEARLLYLLKRDEYISYDALVELAYELPKREVYFGVRRLQDKSLAVTVPDPENPEVRLWRKTGGMVLTPEDVEEVRNLVVETINSISPADVVKTERLVAEIGNKFGQLELVAPEKPTGYPEWDYKEED